MIRHFIRSHHFRRFAFRQGGRRLVFWAGALAVGAAAILFAKGANGALWIFHYAYHLSPFLPLLRSPLALVAALTITRRFLPGAQGSGIPQTIAAIRRPELADSGLLSLRIALGKIMMTLLGLVGGASIGREGPTVQVGAAIMLALGRALRLPQRELVVRI
jgi:H+/Cl- antiporter ClcA